MGRRSWIIRVGPGSPGGSLEGKAEGSESGSFERDTLLASKVEDGATSQGHGKPIGAGRGKEMDSPLGQPCRHFGKAHFGLLTSQTKIINSSCFKPLSLWSFDTTVLGKEHKS